MRGVRFSYDTCMVTNITASKHVGVSLLAREAVCLMPIYSCAKNRSECV